MLSCCLCDKAYLPQITISFPDHWPHPLLSEVGEQVFFRPVKIWALVHHGSRRSWKEDRKGFIKLHKWTSMAHKVLQSLLRNLPLLLQLNRHPHWCTCVYSYFLPSGLWTSLLNCSVICLTIQTGLWVKHVLIHTQKLSRNGMAGSPVPVLRYNIPHVES